MFWCVFLIYQIIFVYKGAGTECHSTYVKVNSRQSVLSCHLVGSRDQIHTNRLVNKCYLLSDLIASTVPQQKILPKV